MQANAVFVAWNSMACTMRRSGSRDPAEVANIIAQAASARNGWKVILARCAPTTKPRSMAQVARETIAARDRAEV